MAITLSQLLNLVDELQEPSSPIYDFGIGVHPRYLQNWVPAQRLALNCPCPSTALCGASPAACRRRDAQNQGAVAQVGKDGFQVCMKVDHFKPSELSVKVVDNSILVEGKHEERQDDHGYISRHFVRRYALPQGYEADKVVSQLSSDGVLTVSIPKPQAIEDKSKERVVQIQQVGPAHLNVKENEAVEDKKEQKEEAKAAKK